MNVIGNPTLFRFLGMRDGRHFNSTTNSTLYSSHLVQRTGVFLSIWSEFGHANHDVSLTWIRFLCILYTCAPRLLSHNSLLFFFTRSFLDFNFVKHFLRMLIVSFYNSFRLWFLTQRNNCDLQIDEFNKWASGSHYLFVRVIVRSNVCFTARANWLEAENDRAKRKYKTASAFEI